MVLARWASYDKKMLARQVIPLALGYRTALSSCPGFCQNTAFYSNDLNVLHAKISSFLDILTV